MQEGLPMLLSVPMDNGFWRFKMPGQLDSACRFGKPGIGFSIRATYASESSNASCEWRPLDVKSTFPEPHAVAREDFFSVACVQDSFDRKKSGTRFRPNLDKLRSEGRSMRW